MSRKIKKELILEIFLNEGFLELTPEAIEIINSKLIEHYGLGGKTSAAYIAQILTLAGQQVYFTEDLAQLELEENDNENSLHRLNFDTLETAEKSLLFLDKRFKELQIEENHEGLFYCKDFAKRAKLRATLIAENEKLPKEKRDIKKEVAFWFEIWLSTPEIFKDWIELRKISKVFQEQFGKNL